MIVYLQRSVSIQPRTSFLKFVGNKESKWQGLGGMGGDLGSDSARHSVMKRIMINKMWIYTSNISFCVFRWARFTGWGYLSLASSIRNRFSSNGRRKPQFRIVRKQCFTEKSWGVCFAVGIRLQIVSSGIGRSYKLTVGAQSNAYSKLYIENGSVA